MSEEKKFIFAVITYNHGEYIVEHLESIKYLILKYGDGYQFKLVVADDGSKDNTIDIIKQWLSKNETLFFEVVIEADGVNRGTCINYTNLWKHINCELFKVTAGDDVYSFLNVIKEAEGLKENDFISGFPLLLIDGEIKKSKATIFHMIATDVIYKNRKFIERMKQISVINTPSLLYNSKFLKDRRLFDFIRSFKVTEDYPMMVKIAETYDDIKFKQADEVFVYYRRTAGSTYLVRGSDFDNDKLKVFNEMLSNENTLLGKFLLKNRIKCYLSDNLLYKKMFNFNYYLYLLRIVACSLILIKRYLKVRVDVDMHKAHYLYLRSESRKYLLK